MNQEKKRLEAQRLGTENWRLWGPYLSERAWGTVREDYSPDGRAWEHFDHDQARSRAYRWNEDGMGGICDAEQRLCLALGLWNGRDSMLKERMFGLTSNQGNHGEDVKEYFFYEDATPSHSFLKYLYKYPQAEFPYALLTEENQRRSRSQAPFSLLDTGVFQDSRYWDVEVTYAKENPETIFSRIRVVNRGPEKATLHLLPSLWFRNTWSWGKQDGPKPLLQAANCGDAAWAVEAKHPTLGSYYLYGRQEAKSLFTENDTNLQRLFNTANSGPYVKDGFHRLIVNGEEHAVNPGQEGTKFAAQHVLTCEPGGEAVVELVLQDHMNKTPFAPLNRCFSTRKQEADHFYAELVPRASGEDASIFRQAMAGMVWCKQFFNYDVGRWLDGDQQQSSQERHEGRNRNWRHMEAADIISMPDSWEYPWFAAWDLAYHSMVLAQLDVDFAKDQIELLLSHRYLHPKGQIPAYEWDFDDVNPPVHAVAALKVFRADRKQKGKGDLHYLRRVFNKLIMNYGWWLNQKDSDGLNVFEGGFMGLDNISIYDRSKRLPVGYSLKQADATGWMAMFALNMTSMALELAQEDCEYEDMAIQCYQQFLAIANSIAGHTKNKLSLWDAEEGFFKDLLITPDSKYHHIDVYSYVGLIPLFACEIVTAEILDSVPRFKAMLDSYMGGMFDGHTICACPFHTNDCGERLLSLVDHTMIPHILKRLLNEHEFLSEHGVRGLSRIHAEKRELGVLPGVGEALIEYEPGESQSFLFGGNSNWRGPVWMPINYSIIQALTKFHRFLGPNFTVYTSGKDSREVNLREVSNLIGERLINIFRRDENGRVASLPADSPFQDDPHWRNLRLFYEYFHGESGVGLGACHQTGWTGLVANLIKRHYDLQAQAGTEIGKLKK
ncbi:MAG: glucosidase [Proteobacteria bacterium]|nr:glucosidase [Pseudomonadota bacterium]MBU1061015.1 glucosidase [Pseudomonadota bacterium]